MGRIDAVRHARLVTLERIRMHICPLPRMAAASHASMILRHAPPMPDSTMRPRVREIGTPERMPVQAICVVMGLAPSGRMGHPPASRVLATMPPLRERIDDIDAPMPPSTVIVHGAYESPGPSRFRAVCDLAYPLSHPLTVRIGRVTLIAAR